MVLVYKKTPELEAFFELFRAEQCKDPDWDYLAEAFKRDFSYDGRSLNIRTYINEFVDNSRWKLIKRIAKNCPELEIETDVDWDVEVGSEEHKFHREIFGRYYIENSIIGMNCDNLLRVKGIPTLINFRYMFFPALGGEKRGLIVSLFGSNAAYGIIATENCIGERSQIFMRRGGFVVPFPMDGRDLECFVRDACSKHGLNIKERQNLTYSFLDSYS